MGKRARLIYNPTSGREEMRRRLPDILQRLEQGGYETSCHATTAKYDAMHAAQDAVKAKFDVVIAAGGDGTLNEVISGLATAPIEERPTLGLIPVGTTNDFARALGIPKKWEQAVELIVRGDSRTIDLGQINDKYFVNIAAGGSLTELTYEVPSRLKTLLGQAAYYLKGFEKLPGLQPMSLNIKHDNGEIEGEFMVFLIANSNSVGGFEKLAPGARIDDGLLDVVLLRKINVAELFLVVAAVSRGEHLSDPRFVHFQTTQLQVTSDRYTQLNVDGEYGGTLPCTCRILPGHLNMFIDITGDSSYRG
jgi:diacylglycerol kinase (ATP)